MSAALAHRPTPLRALTILAALLVAAASMAACSGSGSGGGAPGGTSAAAPTVSGAWVRVPMNAAGPAAAFLTISNPGSSADALLSASSPAAEAVEVHETKMDANGMMGMSPIARLEIPAGGSVELKSGSYHIMLVGLKQPLKAGDTVELTLTFEKAGPVVVRAEVRAG